MLFGVAGGMAEWMDLDPAIVRLVWALLILAGGVGLLLYIIAAIVIPEAPYVMGPAGTAGAMDDAAASAAVGAGTPDPSRWEARRARRAARRRSGNPGLIFGLILVVLGAWFLLDRYIPALDLSWFMPAALIVIGLVLVVGAMGRSGRTEG
jgi:phage shock protein PspC (stress-responsive transcriptional regulator)